jgi:hypothetical protein
MNEKELLKELHHMLVLTKNENKESEGLQDYYNGCYDVADEALHWLEDHGYDSSK